MKKVFTTLSLLLILSMSLAAADALLSPVVLVDLIYPEPIYQEEVDENFEEAQIFAAQLGTEVSKKLVLEGIIEEKLLLQGAEEVGITVASSDIDTMVAQYKSLIEDSVGFTLTQEQFMQVLTQELNITMEELRENLEQQYIVEQYIRAEKADVLSSVAAPTEAEILEIYNEYISQFALGKSVQVAHIFIDSTERDAAEALDLAEAIAWNVQSGKMSFEDAVITYTEDSDTQFNDGELGWIALNNSSVKSEMGQSFVSGIFAIDEGVVSDPIKSNFGYHIVKITDSAPARILDLDDPLSFTSTVTVRQSIKEQIFLSKQTAMYQQAQKDLILELRDRAEITYFAEVE